MANQDYPGPPIPGHQDPTLPSMPLSSQTEEFLKSRVSTGGSDDRTASTAVPMTKGPQSAAQRSTQTRKEPWGFLEEFDWKQGWDIIDDFFPEPDFGVELLPEQMEIGNIRNTHGQSKQDDTQLQKLTTLNEVFGPEAFQGVIVGQRKEEMDEKPNSDLPTTSESAGTPPNTQNAPKIMENIVQASATRPMTSQVPAPLPVADVQSHPRALPLQKALPLRSRSPVTPSATPYAALNSPALPSSSVLGPSTSFMDRARAYRAVPVELPSSSPLTRLEAQQLAEAPVEQVDPKAPIDGEARSEIEKSQKDGPKKAPAKSIRRKRSKAKLSTPDDVQPVPDRPESSSSTIPTDPSIQNVSQSTIPGSVETSNMDNSWIYQLEREAKGLSQEAKPQNPPVKKTRAPRQRKKQKDTPSSVAEDPKLVGGTGDVNGTDKDHPNEDTPTPKRKARKPAQPRKKGAPTKATKDGPNNAESSAEMKVDEAAGLEVGGPVATTAESTNPASAKSEVDKPEASQGRETRSRKKATGGQKRKGTGLEGNMNASGSSGKGTVANGAVRNKKARVQKVEKDDAAHEPAPQQ